VREVRRPLLTSLSSRLAHGAFKKSMPNKRTSGSDQFVEAPILPVMV